MIATALIVLGVALALLGWHVRQLTARIVTLERFKKDLTE